MSDVEVTGVWVHVLKKSPPPEHEEIAHLIGKKLIDENQNLWRELQAVKSIIFEMNGNNVNNSKIGLSSTSREVSGTKSKNNGKRSILNAKNFSNLYYDNDESVTQTNLSSDAAKIYKISHFSVEIIGGFLTTIRAALSWECDDLEEEVSRLSREMETQAENVFSFNNTAASSSAATNWNATSSHSSQSDGKVAINRGSQQSTDMFCVTCSNKMTVNEPSVANKAPQQASLLDRERVCSSCREFRDRRDAKISGKITPNGTGDHFVGGLTSSVLPNIDLSRLPPHNNQSTDSSAKSTPRSGGNVTSRFRNRLDTARDELFFLDEF